jgi:hypothetical protein
MLCHCECLACGPVQRFDYAVWRPVIKEGYTIPIRAACINLVVVSEAFQTFGVRKRTTR